MFSTAFASQVFYHIQRIPQDRSDFWSRMPFLMALAPYHESLPDSQQGRKQLVEAVAQRFFMQVEERPSPSGEDKHPVISLGKHEIFRPWATWGTPRISPKRQ